MKLTAEQAMFYLFQCFQLLGTRVGPLVETFLLDYAKKSPLFSHNLIWHCKLEANSNMEDDNYFAEHAPRRATANALMDKVLDNFSAYEKNVFEELDRFLESVTGISSKMEPTMPTQQKLDIIEHFAQTIKVPALAYLPTNPSMQVVSIIKGTGRPLQSKAKCPFLLGFVCKPFEGIDKAIARRKQTIVLGKIWNEISDRPKTAIEIRNFTTGFTSVVSSGSSLGVPLPTNGIARMNSIGSGKGAIFQTDRKKSEATVNSNRKTLRINDLGEIPSAHRSAVNGLKNFDELSQVAFSKLSNVQSIPDPVVDEPRMTYMRQDNSLLDSIKQTGEGFNKDHQVISCIFKTKDDIRQDFLTLQFITLLKQAFKIEKSSLLLTPYRVFSNRTGDVT